MLLPRVITAVTGIPLVLFIIHQGGLPFISFVLLVSALALYEYAVIMRLGAKPVQRVPLFALGAFLAAATIFDRSPLRPPGGDNFVPFAVSAAILGCMAWEIFSKRHSMERIAFTVFGIFFIPWNLAHLVHIRDMRPYGEPLTYTLIVTVWIMDTAAYAAGKSWGRNRLAETISPKKTWEGAIAGFISAVLCVLAMRRLFMPETMSAAGAAAAGALIGALGQLSDMAESVVKRSVGVKDSSNLLPGHGGILDRFDSYLLLAPVLYYALVFSR